MSACIDRRPATSRRSTSSTGCKRHRGRPRVHGSPHRIHGQNARPCPRPGGLCQGPGVARGRFCAVGQRLPLGILRGPCQAPEISPSHARLRTITSSVSALSNTLLQTARARCYNRPRFADQLRTRDRLSRDRPHRRHGLRHGAPTARSETCGGLAPVAAHALRVRPAVRGHAELPLRDQLLPDRDAVHPVRHRGRSSSTRSPCSCARSGPSRSSRRPSSSRC